MKKRLYKSNTDKKVCGVCGGIAEYLNVDPTWIRLATALLCLGYGSGILVYIVMALVMPDEPTGVSKVVDAEVVDKEKTDNE